MTRNRARCRVAAAGVGVVAGLAPVTAVAADAEDRDPGSAAATEARIRALEAALAQQQQLIEALQRERGAAQLDRYRAAR